jgi:hypothetical protein
MKEAWTKISDGLRLVRWLVVLPSLSSVMLVWDAWAGQAELDRILAMGFANVVFVILSLQE